ncbi:MAG TPA: SDR family NAD(P)-dependent oxidoreductase [Bryobacteraceae bacterium]|nr:SDR family NAD(P)-dependent oxidoreductase [Bryobacteraceae bacterium]
MALLEQKVALITGAKGGLGGHVTEAFLAEGATVAGVSRSIEASDFSHPRFAAMPSDLSTGESANRLAAEVAAKFQRIDALVHLMGGFEGGHSVHETGDDALDRMLDMNLKSAFFMARAVLPYMRKQGGGRIIAIGSRAAAEPSPGAGVYAASKAALVSLILTMAAENKDRSISANILLPGTMDTPANRKSMPGADYAKWVQPAQVATLAVSLASDKLSQVSGAVIPIYGAEV